MDRQTSHVLEHTVVNLSMPFHVVRDEILLLSMQSILGDFFGTAESGEFQNF